MIFATSTTNCNAKSNFKKKKKKNYIFQKLSKICKKSLNLSVQECMLAEIGCNRK